MPFEAHETWHPASAQHAHNLSAQPCAQSPRTPILRCVHKCAQPLRAQPLRTTFAHNPRAQGQTLCAQGYFSHYIQYYHFAPYVVSPIKQHLSTCYTCLLWLPESEGKLPIRDLGGLSAIPGTLSPGTHFAGHSPKGCLARADFSAAMGAAIWPV